MNNQKGDCIMPIIDEDENIILFDSIEEAKRVLHTNTYLAAFGGEIFQLGNGEEQI